MIFTDRARVDATLRKLTHSDNTVENVHIEEVENNVTTNGTPLNGSNFNTQEKNIGTYGSDTYDNTATYDVGDIVTYEGLLYRCKTEIETPETFNSAHWDQISLLDMTEENTESIKTKANSADLSAVAMSGSYDDLTDKPVVNANSTETDEAYSCKYINDNLKMQVLSIDDLFSSYNVTKPTDYAIYQIGNMIHINRLNFAGITISSSTDLILGVLKSKYRPSTSIRTLANVGGGATINAVIFVNPDGNVTLQSSTSGSNTNSYWFSNSWVFE